ncbi:type VI secretion system tube protein TssD [Pedobacter rhodius]|uniref:Type VI secretion system tube protein TssD n=1 Tax=Pedobacter rhodius TaxID=3004098 RepID=A0ABT4KWD7_9SPHI|nr:type VI secretion system tube protein TssD [Pedobacter sp. SJ11]MCZ4223250.1 type VI secretion system tube protein TssD [Pedobacter sp. SJ11]
MLNISVNGKTINAPLNSVSTSFSRYYDDDETAPAGKSKDSTSTKSGLSLAGNKSGIFHLNLNAKNLPDEILKLMARKKSSFNGTITITDTYRKLSSKTIKFFKASLYSFSDHYSATYYGDSTGNIILLLNCNAMSINGISIES